MQTASSSLRLLTASMALAWLVLLSGATLAAERPPNVVFILADDLGFGDLGAYGQTKIQTPNIDSLAAEGMKFTRSYSGNAVCAPSRCVLMTGKHPGHAVIRDNKEMKSAGLGLIEGQFPLPEGTATLPRLFQKAGYVTGAFGKWGLGSPTTSGEPLRQGIDRFFGYNCQAVAHNFYPVELWDNDKTVPLNNPKFAAHQKLPAGAEPKDPASYERYVGPDYSADLIAAQAVQFVHDNKEKPFFLFVPTTIPHLALQAPADAIAQYAGKLEDEPYLGDRGYLPHLTPHACYAAMVSRMDQHVGNIMAAVAEHGLDENTIYIFTSDNGPLYDRLGGTDTEFFNSCHDLRGRKGSLYEGGIRAPLLVRWKGKIAASQTTALRTGFEDWIPTLLDLIGQPDLTPADLDGVSIAATLLGQPQTKQRESLYREFPGYGSQQAVWKGDWKAIRQQMKPNGSTGRTELYNLKTDEKESTNVAAEHPEVVRDLEAIMAKEHTPSKEFPLFGVDTPPAKPKAKAS
jgi:arylsulfatase A